ncbi:lipopolysaccharide biosynthesis protein RfbH [Candidatus Woesearchaeota archaeon]|nr:lipopolysaccharide biosynthesis protein RfbH [Candidatus Woesearchaeota archaeon]
MKMSEKTKKEILDLVERYHGQTRKELPPDKVPVSGKVYDAEELKNLVEASLEGWWTEGRFNSLFEKKLRDLLGIKHVLTTNSGSSALLIALSTLSSKKLGERRIKAGDEVITAAAAFPTTVNPIIQVDAVPVFVDVELGNYNVRAEDIESAITPKTKAIVLAHTLGNPFELGKVKRICEENKLWLVEDNCDALGSKYDGRYTGTFGDMASLSFYPAHHITTAEGGALLTNSPELYKIARSVRDWGRDCSCPTGKDDTCGKRFSWKLGDLPYGYDHKYTYSEIGYNLKMTDIQAAIGVAQMDKLEGFTKKRRENYDYLYEKMKEFSDHFILPEETGNSEPSWFGFILTIRDERIDRKDLMEYLNANGIGTRLLFCGNIIRQPSFKDNDVLYRKAGKLENTDIIMNRSFWIGVYHGLGREQLDHACQKLRDYIKLHP